MGVFYLIFKVGKCVLFGIWGWYPYTTQVYNEGQSDAYKQVCKIHMKGLATPTNQKWESDAYKQVCKIHMKGLATPTNKKWESDAYKQVCKIHMKGLAIPTNQKWVHIKR